jgi:hypothetical protein
MNPTSCSTGRVVEARRSFLCENAVMIAVAKVKHESQRHQTDLGERIQQLDKCVTARGQAPPGAPGRG